MINNNKWLMDLVYQYKVNNHKDYHQCFNGQIFHKIKLNKNHNNNSRHNKKIRIQNGDHGVIHNKVIVKLNKLIYLVQITQP